MHVVVVHDSVVGAGYAGVEVKFAAVGTAVQGALPSALIVLVGVHYSG